MRRYSLLLAFSILAACGNSPANDLLGSLPPGEFPPGDNPPALSAPMAFFVSIGPALSAAGSAAACPVVTRTNEQTTVVGGCVDAEGDEWFGRATLPPVIVGSMEPPAGTYTYEDFGQDEATGCATSTDGRQRNLINGTTTVTDSGDIITFNLDIIVNMTGVLDDCSVQADPGFEVAIVYSGQAVQNGDESTWNGSGAFGGEALGEFAGGRYDISTDDEVLNNTVCGNEPISGSTTVAGEDTAVITYDGASDCDPEGTATWTLNGMGQGEMTGVRCSASPGSGSSAFMLAVVGAAALVFAKRRRS